MLINKLVGMNGSFINQFLSLGSGVIENSVLVADDLLITLDLLRSLTAKLTKQLVNLLLVDDNLGLRKRLWLQLSI